MRAERFSDTLTLAIWLTLLTAAPLIAALMTSEVRYEDTLEGICQQERGVLEGAVCKRNGEVLWSAP